MQNIEQLFFSFIQFTDDLVYKALNGYNNFKRKKKGFSDGQDFT